MTNANEINDDEMPTTRGATHTEDGRELRKIWQKFSDSGDTDSRNELTEFYFDMVRANVENIGQILVEAMEEGDFAQSGAVAFFEAMNEFDPAIHNSFEEYGSLAIRKAIVDEIRALVGSEETPDEME